MGKIFNLIFFGTPQISVTILEALCKMENIHITAVVSQPNRLKNRFKELLPTAVAQYCQKNNLRVLQPEKVGSITNELAALEPDIILTCAYGQILPVDILRLPKFKALNIHTSLLPKWRGGAPIARAIMNGDYKTGVSIMDMVQKMDAGAFYIQKEIPIKLTDTTDSLTNQLAILSAHLVQQTLIPIINDEFPTVEQDATKVVYAPNIKAGEAKINWRDSSETILNLIRAMYSNPVAYTTTNNSIIYKVHKGALLNTDETLPGQPGDILQGTRTGLIVKTGTTAILLELIQKQGKKVAPANQYSHLVGKQFI